MDKEQCWTEYGRGKHAGSQFRPTQRTEGWESTKARRTGVRRRVREGQTENGAVWKDGSRWFELSGSVHSPIDGMQPT